MAGYSGTPLPRKLGIKPRITVVVLSAPMDYRRVLGEVPAEVTFSQRISSGAKFVHLFARRRADLKRKLGILRRKVADDAVVWVSWPKKSSGISTDVTEDIVRAEALPLGFVDVKVCAVDATWSGLKLMIRRENRTSRK